MDKNFDKWNVVKKNLDSSDQRLFFKEREVWWCSLGINVGDEQNGKGEYLRRPILVIKKFNSRLLVAIPLSTKIKDFGFYHKFELRGREQCAVLSQIRILDSKRLSSRLGTIPSDEFDLIREKVENLIFK